MNIQEGIIPFHGYRTWYRIAGGPDEPGRLPLLCLHGGPGASWDYLEPLEALSLAGRRVVFYDQLGGGNSDETHDPSFYNIDLFVEEVAAVRHALGLEWVHLLGQSWGGMLALEVALRQPQGLASLILADTSASLPHWAAEMNRLVAELPPRVQQTLRKHQEAGTTDSTKYKEAYRVYSLRHICRLDHRPDCFKRMVGKPGDEVYHAMWGPSEIHVTGSLKDWDVTGRLGEIRLPTLVLGGRYDEATPALGEELHCGIPGSEWVVFEHSAHVPHLEETERYLEVLGSFLSRVERVD